MRIGSLFSGIGGLELGLEWAGLGKTVWQVESDDYCNKVLVKHWPDVRRYRDVREVHGAITHTESQRGGSIHRRDGEQESIGIEGNNRIWGEEKSACPNCLEPVDLICGGFPCQPFSVAGKRRGKEDNRHLWPEFKRIIAEIHPAWVVGENVLGIINMELDTVLSDLEGEGYETATFVLPACGVDAPHRRYRVFVVAHSRHDGRGQGIRGIVSKNGERRFQETIRNIKTVTPTRPDTGQENVADTDHAGNGTPGCGINGNGQTQDEGRGEQSQHGACGYGQTGAIWLPEPELCGVDDGFPQKLYGGRLNAGQRMGAENSEQRKSEKRMRELWFNGAFGFTPQGHESDKQLTRKLTDTLSIMPHEMALGEWEATVEAERQVQSMRQTCETAGLLRNPQQPFSEAWVTFSGREREYVLIASNRGQFIEEWPGVPRVAEGVPDRKNRLKCLGNAVVPQVSMAIGLIIKEWIEQNET